MEESDLTRKAIEELMKEMNQYKEKKYTPTERKKNPLGRPNKQFLGRTINSVMTHNKRQSDRNLRRCERKLKELDAKQSIHKLGKHSKNHSKSHSLHEVLSSDSYEEVYRQKKFKKIKEMKRRKKKYGSRSSSSSSTTSSSSTNSSSISENSCIQSKNKHYRKEKRKMVNDEEYSQNVYADCSKETTMGYYVDPNMAYAIMACSQMNHMMQQQEVDTKELKESIEIPSDLSLSCCSSSESSLNISLHSSSAEEDENGILTFKLSSDDEEKSSHFSRKSMKNSREANNNKIYMEFDENDNDSAHSHISLDSKDSESCILKGTSEIYSLSSSCTDSEETIKKSGNINNLLEYDEKSNSFQNTQKINMI